MVDKMCESITNKIRKENPDIDDERAEIIDYGIHLLFGEIPKFFIIMGIAFVLGVGDLTILAYFLTLPYRAFSGGFHLKSHIGCILGTTIFFSGIGLLAKYLILEYMAKLIVALGIWLFAMIMTKRYAPADTENEPIISRKERKKRKILSYIMLTLSILASLVIKDTMVSNILLYGVLFQSFTITRIAYKLTNNKYGHEVYNTSKELD